MVPFKSRFVEDISPPGVDIEQEETPADIQSNPGEIVDEESRGRTGRERTPYREEDNWKSDPLKPVENSSQESPPLTLGVEWEFLVDPRSSPFGSLRELPPGTQRILNFPPTESWASQSALYHISRFLEELGVSAATGPEVSHALANNDYSRLRFPHVDIHRPRRDRFRDFYIVTADRSITDDVSRHSDKDVWPSIEIASATITPDHISAVVELFRTLRSTFHVKVSPSCGLHVHVGNNGRGFSMPWMRNMAAIFWAASDIFDKFHPAERGPFCPWARGVRYFSHAALDGYTQTVPVGPDGPKNQPDGAVIHKTGTYPFPGYDIGPQPVNQLPDTSVPASDPRPGTIAATDTASWATSLLSREVLTVTLQRHSRHAGHRGSTFRDRSWGWRGVCRLLAASSTREVLMLMQSGTTETSRLGYNMANLRYQGDPQSRYPATVEFRQHGGTTNVDEIGAWMRVCVALVAFCRPQSKGGDGAGHDQDTAVEERIRNVARHAVEGGSGISSYNVYDFMEEIGACDPMLFYLAGSGTARRPK